jgi:hypothetical protein
MTWKEIFLKIVDNKRFPLLTIIFVANLATAIFRIWFSHLTILQKILLTVLDAVAIYFIYRLIWDWDDNYSR